MRKIKRAAAVLLAAMLAMGCGTKKQADRPSTAADAAGIQQTLAESQSDVPGTESTGDGAGKEAKSGPAQNEAENEGKTEGSESGELFSAADEAAETAELQAAIPDTQGGPEEEALSEALPGQEGTAPGEVPPVQEAEVLPAGPDAQEAEEPQAVPDRHFQVVINGDSRTVCLYCSLAYSEEEFPQHLFTHHLSETYSADYGNSCFVAKGGEGYDFFTTYGLALAATHFGEDSVLVVWFGVNDAERADQYITYMNNVSLQFGIPVYYMTIGPCYDSWTKREPGVEEMNRKLRENLRPEIRVIDMFSFIQDGMARGEFGTLDGLHYNYRTCRAIYEHLLEVLEQEYAEGRMEFHYTGFLG